MNPLVDQYRGLAQFGKSAWLGAKRSQVQILYPRLGTNACRDYIMVNVKISALICCPICPVDEMVSCLHYKQDSGVRFPHRVLSLGP